MKKENAITLVALIITIVLMIILIGVAVNFGREAINKSKLEDIITDMISIKTRAKIIADEHNYNEEDNFPGVPVEDLQLLNKLNIEEGKDLYKWNQTTLDNQGLGKIKADTYLVYYDTDNPNDCEVYYPKGVNGKYSLTDLQAEE